MYGIGLKVVVALSNDILIELNDTNKQHIKHYNNGKLKNNVINQSNKDISYFSIEIPVILNYEILLGIILELNMFSKSRVNIFINNNSIKLPNLSHLDILELYSGNMIIKITTKIKLESSDNSFLEMIALIGYATDKCINSILLVNGIRSTSGSWLNVIMKEIQRCYDSDGPLTNIVIVGFVTNINLSLMFNSNDKDKIVNPFKMCTKLIFPKNFFDVLKSKELNKKIDKAINSINLKKITSLSPAISKNIILYIVEGEGAKTSISYCVNRNITSIYTTTGKIPNLDKSGNDMIISNTVI
jgi:hypothetical protein